MKATLIIPVYNEIWGIAEFMQSIYQQTRPLDEIILVDGASNDGTLEFLRKEESEGRIRLFSFSWNIAKARNYAISQATNQLILCTDAGCIVDEQWAEKLISQFESSKDQVIWGVSSYSIKTPFQKKAAQHLLPEKIEQQFVSSRNIAFYKKVWEEVWGYPEELTKRGEDTYFNYKIEKQGYKIARCKEAIVEWGIGKNFKDFFKLYRNYTHGDAEVLILYGVKQSNSVIQWALLLMMLLVLGFSILFGFWYLVTWMLAAIVFRAGYGKKKTGIRFNFLFNLVKIAGIFVGFWRGIWSGVRILSRRK